MSKVASPPNPAPCNRDPFYERFEYDRDNPPMFTFKLSDEEREAGEKSMSNMTREYLRLSRKHNISAQVMLSNGCSAGEYAMWILRTNHKKRLKAEGSIIPHN